MKGTAAFLIHAMDGKRDLAGTFVLLGEGRGGEGDSDVAKVGEADIIVSATSSPAMASSRVQLSVDGAQPPDVSAGAGRLRPAVLAIGSLVRPVGYGGRERVGSDRQREQVREGTPASAGQAGGGRS